MLPEDFLCPFSMAFRQEPMFASDGRAFDSQVDRALAGVKLDTQHRIPNQISPALHSRVERDRRR